MLRYDGISSLGGCNLVEYDPPYLDADFGESVTDDSYYIPTPDNVGLKSIPLTSSEILSNFDFSDGRDTGAPVPKFRKPGADLGEVSQHLREVQGEIKSEVARKAAEKALADKYKVTDSPDTPHAPSVAASPNSV
ncbi:hypothetical protein [Tortoise microvirus 67]|nr:hypothetical protein [Tortoise microvirus 67]